ncbi:MAG: glycosyltransferase family 4 protein [Patescibacteria group bacterium]
MTTQAVPRMIYVANARMPTEKAHGIQIAKMCEAFIEQGVSVELLLPSRGGDRRSIREFYGLRVDVPTRRLLVPDWYGSRIGFVASSFLFALRYFFHLVRRRHIHGERFIIYTTDLDQFSFFLIPFLGIPYFVEMHDAKKKRWAFRLLFWRARAIIAVNDIIRRQLIAVFSIPAERIIVRPNGYDAIVFRHPEEKDDARRVLGLPSGRKIVVYVGRIYAWKGLDTLIATARLLPDVLFYLVGGTQEALQNIGATGEISGNLIAAGSWHHTQIPRWLWAADILIVFGTKKDEYSYFHTSPMKLFEYMAARRPIIASRTPAIEAVVSDENVFFCMPDSPTDTAEKIRFVLEHPAEAEQKTAIAGQNLFSWSTRAEDIANFIRHHL